MNYGIPFYLEQERRLSQINRAFADVVDLKLLYWQ